MNNIKKYPFSELYEMSSGISTTKAQAGHGYPFVSFGTVFNNYFLPEQLPDLMDTSEKEQDIYSIKEGDILITRTSETIDELAMSCVATKDFPKATYSGFTKRLRPKTTGIAYHKYLAFYLRGYLFRKAVTNNAFMTLRASFNEDIFSFLNLYLPEYQEQVKIGDMLYNMERKISLNQKICSELEAMAKTLYDYWFVQFDFPDENGNPYRTSGGEMVWNEQLKREIPKGWNVTTINDMTHSYRGVSYDKKYLLPTAENGILVLRGNNIQNNRLVYDTNVAYVPCSLVSKEQQIRAHDIILTMSSGSKDHIGKCTMFQYDSPHTYGAFLTKFTPDSDKVGFVYLSMISDFFKKKIQAICNGTGINNLTNETFDNLLFPKPGKTILGYFEEIVAPLFEKMGDCDRENEELTKLRDWLLPMLMNGQATVVDAEEKAGKVIPYTPQTVEVRQAARNFGDKETDDTADLVQAYLRRKQHDSKA